MLNIKIHYSQLILIILVLALIWALLYTLSIETIHVLNSGDYTSGPVYLHFSSDSPIYWIGSLLNLGGR